VETPNLKLVQKNSSMLDVSDNPIDHNFDFLFSKIFKLIKLIHQINFNT